MKLTNDNIIEILRNTSAEILLKNAISEDEWDSADRKYGVFINVETKKIEIFKHIHPESSGYIRVAESQNPVSFLGFIDVDTAITSEFENIIDSIIYNNELA